MIRFNFTFDKDAEQAWLNDLCGQGWAMSGAFAGVITFVPCRPGEFIYQIDLLPGSGLRADDYEGYVVFMNDMGVEIIQRWGRWVYLRRRAEEGPFEVYTDNESKIALYRRIRQMFLWVLCLELCASVTAWSLLVQAPDMFARGLVGLYIVLTAVVLRVIWRCSCMIRDLEKRS